MRTGKRCVRIVGSPNSYREIPKVRFESEEAARDQAIRYNAKPGQRRIAVPYMCETCGYWHVGRTAKNNKGYGMEELKLK
jgi:hypothetical protein